MENQVFQIILLAPNIFGKIMREGFIKNRLQHLKYGERNCLQNICSF